MRDGSVLRHILGQRAGSPASSEPPTTFEAVTRQMVVDLHAELKALRERIDGLFSVVVGAIVIDLLFRLAGWK